MPPDETTTTTPPDPTTTGDQAATPPPGNVAPNGQQPPARTFSQAEVDRIVQSRLAEDRTRRQQAPAPKPTTNGTPQTTQTTTPPADDPHAARARERAFDRAIGPMQLSEQQIGIMESESVKQGVQPGDMGSWCQRFAADVFGKQNVSPPPLPTTPPPASPQEQLKPPAAAPSSSQPNASTLVTTGGHVDIYTLTPEQFNALSPQQIREHHERNVAAAHARTMAPPLPKVMQKR